MLAVAILGFCCLCIGFTQLALGVFGDVLSAPFQIFRGEAPATLTLREAIENRRMATIRIGLNCEFSHAEGSLIRSDLPDEGAGGYAQDLAREQVIDQVEETLGSMVFNATDGLVAEFRRPGRHGSPTGRVCLDPVPGRFEHGVLNSGSRLARNRARKPLAGGLLHNARNLVCNRWPGIRRSADPRGKFHLPAGSNN